MLFFTCFPLQIIPEEHGEVRSPGDTGGFSYLPVQPSVSSEGELKLNFSDDEDDDEDEAFEDDFDKRPEEEEQPEEEEETGKDQDQPEVDEDQGQTQGEETGEQEVGSDITQSTSAPEQEDPEAVALKKRT